MTVTIQDICHYYDDQRVFEATGKSWYNAFLYDVGLFFCRLIVPVIIVSSKNDDVKIPRPSNEEKDTLDRGGWPYQVRLAPVVFRTR